MVGRDKQASLRLLHGSVLFRELPERATDELVDQLRSRSFSAGELIVRRNDPGQTMMIVRQGRVKITALSSKGAEVILAVVGPGGVFGEMALLDGSPRSADVQALVDTDVLTLSRSAFLTCLEHYPAVAVQLMGLLCLRLRNTNSLVEETVFLDLSARLFRRIEALAEQYGQSDDNGGVRIDHGLSQQELGDSIGASRESVNKQLRAWKARGLIDTARRVLVVDDLEALRRAAGSEDLQDDLL